jgi:hypothetical protein
VFQIDRADKVDAGLFRIGEPVNSVADRLSEASPMASKQDQKHRQRKHEAMPRAAKH